MSSLGEEFPKEINRVRDLQKQYIAIGPAGSFGAAMMEIALKKAITIQGSGDVIEMISSYKELQEFTE